jgi:RecA-superfamily ATPases implicated in signal transduction
LAAKFIEAACKRKERSLYFAFEESPSQITRNMKSVGIDLAPIVQEGLLKFHANRPTYQGLEMHLVSVHDAIKAFKPKVVVVDPVTNLQEIGSEREVKSMLTRLLDFLKMHQVTAMFTSLTSGGANLDQTELGVSSLMDSWIIVRNLESSGERSRALYLLKSRGQAHSNQVREFVLSKKGLDLLDVYVSDGEVKVGSEKLAQQARDQEKALIAREQGQVKNLSLERYRKTIAAQIEALKADLEVREAEARIELATQKQRMANTGKAQRIMDRHRFVDRKEE